MKMKLRGDSRMNKLLEYLNKVKDSHSGQSARTYSTFSIFAALSGLTGNKDIFLEV